MPRRRLTAIGLAWALAACAELTAESPLFSPADQVGPPPLSEGVWIAISEECGEQNLQRQRFPSDCAPLEIRRQEDGAWQVALRIDLVSGLSREELSEAESSPHGPYRVVLAPAVERPSADAYESLYIGEVTSLADEIPSIGYAVIAPLGSMPAVRMHIISSIGCSDILRDGPIDGIVEKYETRTDANGGQYNELVGCVASSQAAVREAARRSVIEGIDTMTERRYVHVRPR